MTTAAPAPPEVGIIGRTLRLMLGGLLGWVVLTVMRAERTAFNLWVLWFVLGLVVLYLLAHLAVRRWGGKLHPWSGAVLILVPIILLFTLGASPGRLAAVIYLSGAYVLQSVRGVGGSAALALPAFILRRHTHLMGILFAPIDLVEKHLTGPGGLPG